MPENAPPPWLLNMQRYGPPPSYPNLKIPGLNAPIPEGARYGFHPGGNKILSGKFAQQKNHENEKIKTP